MRTTLSTFLNRRSLAIGIACTCMLGAPASAQHFGDWSAPVNLGPAVNSNADDMHPAVTPDGLSLYFSSNRTGGVGGFDLWVSERNSTDEPWGAPQNAGTLLNSPAGEFAPAFDAGGHVLFFGSEQTGGCGGRDLWMSFRSDKHDNFAWGPPVNLGCGVNSSGFDDGPTYFEDESGYATLYFISARPGGLGDRDVWATVIASDGSFTAPVNVAELNSPSLDARPGVRRDGREFFLTSQRAGSVPAAGAPSSDVWWSTRDVPGGTWSTPVNLGVINTSAAEAAPALSKDRTTLFFNSNRPGGAGGLDLYAAVRSR